MTPNLEELNLITEKIIACGIQVSNTLGFGFIEKVYENALSIEFQRNAIDFQAQKSISVSYRGQRVGEFFADFLVENLVLVELKAVKALDEIHFAQCINYLRASNLQICLLLNFGTKRLQVKRIIN